MIRRCRKVAELLLESDEPVDVIDTLFDPVGMRVTEVIEIESDGEPDSVTIATLILVLSVLLNDALFDAVGIRVTVV